MWNIRSFENVRYKKVLFLVWPFGGLFIALQLGLIGFGFSLVVIKFCLEKSEVVTLSYLSLNLISLVSLCKDIPPKIMIIYEVKKR